MEGVDEQVRNAGIKEFLELYAHSSFVITDSFHGTCFSVNFEKPFVCIPADKRANRQEGLLRSLDLQGRIIYNEETFSDLEPELNFDEPRTKLAALRQETLNFLSDAIVGES